MEINKIYNENCLETMKRMPDNFIDLTVTSPPYDGLRKYTGEAEWNFEVFQEIAKELYRVTKQGGVVVWVVGDATIKGSETGTSFKQALYFKEVGFNLHDTMIWNKNSQACHDYRNHRYKQEIEYMFVFSKLKPKTYNEICDRDVKNAGKIIKKSSKRQQDGTIRKYREIKLKDKQARSNLWYCEPERKSEHPAPFPEQLANDHIISWSNEGDIIYDCFMGSGTTAKMAILNNRNYIGSEISKEYCDIIEERLNIIKNNEIQNVL